MRAWVSGLFLYPVKGCRGIALDHAELQPTGLAFDRHWMFVRPDGRFLTQRELPALAMVVPSIKADVLLLQVEAKTYELPLRAAGEPVEISIWNHRLPALTQDPAINQAMSKHLGRPVRLVRFDPSVVRLSNPDLSPIGTRTAFADDYPILVTNTASLDQLNADLADVDAEPVPMTRFRPNIVVSGLPPWSEDACSAMTVGAVRLALVSPCERCIVTTTDQVSGRRVGAEPIKTLKRLHSGSSGQPLFGWNTVPMLESDWPHEIAISDEVRLDHWDRQ